MNKINYLRIALCILSLGLLILFCTGDSTEPTDTFSRNYALSFDGIDDCVFIGAINSELDHIYSLLTIESWIYIKSFPNIAPRVIDRSDNISAAPDGDRIVFNVFAPDSSIALNLNGYAIRSNSLPIKKWVHVAASYNGNEMKIYVDGELINTKFHTDYLSVRESELYIGNDSATSTRQYDGYIDDIRIWGIERSMTEIKDNINEKLSGNEFGLLSYWSFDEGKGQFIQDKSPHKVVGHLGKTPQVDSSDPEWIEVKFPFHK
jgi:hypothetical protein